MNHVRNIFDNLLSNAEVCQTSATHKKSDFCNVTLYYFVRCYVAVLCFVRVTPNLSRHIVYQLARQFEETVNVCVCGKRGKGRTRSVFVRADEVSKR
jgi:hypothetical protein